MYVYIYTNNILFLYILNISFIYIQSQKKSILILFSFLKLLSLKYVKIEYDPPYSPLHKNPGFKNNVEFIFLTEGYRGLGNTIKLGNYPLKFSKSNWHYSIEFYKFYTQIF